MSPKVTSSPRFPLRTLVLMVLALAAFIWMYLASHRSAQPTGQTTVQTAPSATVDAGT